MVWEKGTSGNPKGRPRRGTAMTDELKRILSRKPEGETKNNRRLVAEALVEAALAGNVMAAREIFDRVEGKVVQPQELSGPEGTAIPVEGFSLTELLKDADTREALDRLAELLESQSSGDSG